MDLEELENINIDNDKRKYLINGLEDLYEEQKYSEIDNLIPNFINYAFDFDLYLTFLGISFRYTNELKNRNLLYKRSLEISTNEQKEFLLDRYKPKNFDHWLMLETRKNKIKKLIK